MMDEFPGLRTLKTIEAAGRHLNFTKAAVELGLTPAAVSHQVREFQDRLGVPLFEKVGRAMRHTLAGQAVHRAIGEAIRELARAGIQAQKLGGKPRLQISTAASIGTKWLIPRINKFMMLRGDVSIGVEFNKYPRDFAREKIDFAFHWGDGNYEGVRSELVFGHRIFPVCSPSLIHRKQPKDPRALLDFTLLYVDWGEADVIWPDWQRWFQAASVEDFGARPGLHFHETVHAVQAAIDGHGIALGDAALVADDLASGRLIRLFDLAIDGPGSYGYYMTYPEDRADDPTTTTFRDWVLSEAQETIGTYDDTAGDQLDNLDVTASTIIQIAQSKERLKTSASKQPLS